MTEVATKNKPNKRVKLSSDELARRNALLNKLQESGDLERYVVACLELHNYLSRNNNSRKLMSIG